MVILGIMMVPSFMVYLENFSLASFVPQSHCDIGQSNIDPLSLLCLKL